MTKQFSPELVYMLDALNQAGCRALILDIQKWNNNGQEYPWEEALINYPVSLGTLQEVGMIVVNQKKKIIRLTPKAIRVIDSLFKAFQSR